MSSAGAQAIEKKLYVHFEDKGLYMVYNECNKYEELTREAENLFSQITTNGLSSSKNANPFLEYYEEKEELKISTGLTYNTL